MELFFFLYVLLKTHKKERKMKKHILIGLASVLLLTGCNNKSNILNETQLADNGTVTIVEERSYNQVGDIIEFGDGEVHILLGDIIEVFKVSNEMLDSFYLGETVSIEEEGEDEYSLMTFNSENFNVRHNTMGELIQRIEGQLVEIKDDLLYFDTDLGQLELTYTGQVTLDNFYTIDYLDSGYITELYSQTAKLEVTIDSLDRNVLGHLMITASNGQEKYIIPSDQAVKNFNLKDLQVGQQLDVYYTRLLESFPVQVEASRIDLLDPVIEGHQMIDYDVIGEIIEIDGSQVHILSGDLVDIFVVDETLLKTVHLGETVKIYSKNDQLMIEAFIIEDFSVKHTNMGQMITPLIGSVQSVDKKNDGYEVCVLMDDEKIKMMYYGDDLPQVEKTYEFDTVSFSPEELSIMAYYDPETILEVDIREISRSDHGELMVHVSDEDHHYIVGTSYPIKNFNLSELKIGDTLLIYVDHLMESDPIQVNTRRIDKK